eukprot:s2454_g2.t1
MLITELLAMDQNLGTTVHSERHSWEMDNHSSKSHSLGFDPSSCHVICFFCVFYFSAHQERSMWPLPSASAATRSQPCTQDIKTVAAAHTRCHHASLWTLVVPLAFTHWESNVATTHGGTLDSVSKVPMTSMAAAATNDGGLTWRTPTD